MGTRFSIQPFGLRNVTSKMLERSKKLGRMRPANKQAAQLIQSWTLRNMDADGRKHDNASLFWPQLAPSTIARRRKGRGPSGTELSTGRDFSTPKMLQDTGRLIGAFVVRADNKKGWVVNRTKYAADHEFGTRNRRPPRRKMFPSIEQGQKIVFKIYGGHVGLSIK